MIAAVRDQSSASEREEPLHAWRCWRCGRLLARLRLLPGCAVQVRCKCGADNAASVDKGKAIP